MVNLLTVGSGKDYATLQAAIDALPGSAWTEPQVIEVDGGTYDEVVDVSRAGAVSSSVNNLTIRPRLGDWHPGQANGAVAWPKFAPTSSAGAGHNFTLGIAHTKVYGFEVTRVSGAATSDEGFRATATGCEAIGCIVHGLTHLEADAFYVEDGIEFTVSACVIYDIARAAFDLYAGGGTISATLNVYNNTVVDCARGLWVRDVAGADTVVVNAYSNIIVDCSTAAWDVDTDATFNGDRNLSEVALPSAIDDGRGVCVVGDAAATPTGDRWIVFEETTGSVDYRLANERNAAIKFGIGSGQDSKVSDVDLTGADRLSTYWTDAGAHQVSAGGFADWGVSQHTVPKSSGVLEFTCPTGKGEPVGAIAFSTQASSDNTDTAHAMMCIGFMDQARAGFTAISSDDAVSTTDAWRMMADGNDQQVWTSIRFGGSGGTEDARADFLHLTKDGMVWDVTAAPSTARRVMVLWFFGNDVGVEAAYFDAFSGVIGGVRQVSLENLRAPTSVFGMTADDAPDLGQKHAHLSFGAAHYNGTAIEQANIGFWQEDARGFSVATTVWSDDHFLSFHDGTAANQSLEVTQLLKPNPDFTTRDEATTSKAWMLFLELPDGIDMSVEAVTSSAGTGSQSFTGTGFTPGVGLLCMVDNANAADIVWVSGGGFGIAALYDDTASHSMSFWDDTLASPTIAKSRSDADILLPDEGGAGLIDGTFTSFDADGFTINRTAGAAGGSGFWVMLERRKVELEAEGTVSVTGSAALESFQDLEAAGTASVTGAADLTANADMDAAGTVTVTGAASLSGPQDMAAAGTASVTGTADLETDTALAAAGTVSATGSASLTARQSLSAAGTVSATGTASLDGEIALEAAGTVSVTGAADLGGPQELAAAGTVSVTGTADLSAENTYVAAGTVEVTGSAELDAYQGLLAAGTITVVGTADLEEPAVQVAASGFWLRELAISEARFELAQISQARVRASVVSEARFESTQLEAR